jgi:hypothetical protein
MYENSKISNKKLGCLDDDPCIRNTTYDKFLEQKLQVNFLLVRTFMMSLDFCQCPLSTHVVCLQLITYHKLLDALERIIIRVVLERRGTTLGYSYGYRKCMCLINF